MSCCGRSPMPSQARSGVFHNTPGTPGSLASSAQASAAPTDPWMQYVGGTALTVTGPVTGRVYRFAAPGARLSVNRHDAASLLYVPSLKPSQA